MGKAKSKKWFRLDNASKIFPPNSRGRDTNVFRFSCELNEAINHETLQYALDKTLDQFPFYRSILRRGFFWMYFEQSSYVAFVHKENTPICGRLFDPNVKNLLFDVSYYGNRINLEVFHALSDGTGALHFLKQLIWEYLKKKHAYGDDIEHLVYDASHKQKAEDSFSRHYRTDNKKRVHKKRILAFKDKHPYMPLSQLQIIEAHASVKACLMTAKKKNASLTEYLAATLLLSYNQNMTWKDRRRPVVLAVPVNLRNFFKSETARNFFALVYIRYLFSSDEESYTNVLQSVKNQFRKKVTQEHLSEKVHDLVKLERNPFIRGIPLFIKNPVLQIGNNWVQKESTTTLSNLGKIEMPAFCHEHIKYFIVSCATERTQLSICSFEDTLTLSFSTSFSDIEIQKSFFRQLSADGLQISITTSNRDI